MQALLVGPPLKVGRVDHVHVVRSPSFVNSPNLTDFRILVIQYSRERLSRDDPVEKRRELAGFLLAGGLCYVIPVDPSMNRTAKIWCPVAMPALLPNCGTEIRWAMDSQLSRLMHDYQFEWECAVEMGSEVAIRPLGWNNVGQTVAFSLRSGLGEIAFVPNPKDRKTLAAVVRSQIRFAAEKIAERTIPPAPRWYMAFGGDLEQRLHGAAASANAELAQFLRIKACLFATGPALTDSIAVGLRQLLSPLGYRVEDREGEGHQDIEAESEDMELRIECKGVKGSTDIDDVRQLHDYCTRTPPKKSLKGILVVNHFRNDPPQARGQVATTEAVNLAKAHGYCILSAPLFFQSYLAVTGGKLGREKFLDQLVAGVGVLPSFLDELGNEVS